MISTNAGKAGLFLCVAVFNGISQEWSDARAAVNEVFTSPAHGQISLAINQARHRIDTAFSKLQNAESYVETLENALQINERWTDASPEYKALIQENVFTNYGSALDELERLVVMRLFELAKMSSSGTGTHFTPLLEYVEQLYQVISFVDKLARLSSAAQKPSKMQSADTTLRQRNSHRHVHR